VKLGACVLVPAGGVVKDAGAGRRLRDAVTNRARCAARPARGGRATAASCRGGEERGAGIWLEGLGGPCPVEAGHVLGWTELLLNAGCARLFDPGFAEKSAVRVLATERPGAVHTIAIERRGDEAWVRGPTSEMRRAIVRPPLRVWFYNTFGLKMNLGVAWSLWTGAGAPEREGLDAALRLVAAQGWDLEFEEQGYG
jgi:hypothetical protein